MEYKSNSENIKLEQEIYKSCLKQVVQYLNSTLPEISDSEELEGAKPKLTKNENNEAKDIIQHNIEEDKGNYYLIRDVKPSRKFEKTAKSENSASKKKRVNKFSERKFKDFKLNKSIRKSKKN